MTKNIQLTGISKTFQDQSGELTPVIDNIDLSINDGEIIAIIGPNGCGKSTFLKIVAKLLPSSGVISFSGKHAEDIRYGFVFQNYSDSLLPWLNNLGNIALSLPWHLSRAEKNKTITGYVASLGLEHSFQLHKYPYECSSGQQQLVALIRELMFEPDILLMDEPSAALDLERKLRQQLNLIDIFGKTKPTVILISHDLEEAIFLADRVVLFSKRPAKIVNIYEIDLPKPRTIEMLTSEGMLDIKQEILKDFKRVIDA